MGLPLYTYILLNASRAESIALFRNLTTQPGKTDDIIPHDGNYTLVQIKIRRVDLFGYKGELGCLYWNGAYSLFVSC